MKRHLLLFLLKQKPSPSFLRHKVVVVTYFTVLCMIFMYNIFGFHLKIPRTESKAIAFLTAIRNPEMLHRQNSKS
jgi:Ni,Fe-hydrogenase I cytochrome b subunit